MLLEYSKKIKWQINFINSINSLNSIILSKNIMLTLTYIYGCFICIIIHMFICLFTNAYMHCKTDIL